MLQREQTTRKAKPSSTEKKKKEGKTRTTAVHSSYTSTNHLLHTLRPGREKRKTKNEAQIILKPIQSHFSAFPRDTAAVQVRSSVQKENVENVSKENPYFTLL